MTAGDRPARHLPRPLPPAAERTSARIIPAIEAAALAPQRKRRAGDHAAGRTIRPIDRSIDGDGGAVFLADGMDGGGVAERSDIGGPRLGGKACGIRAPSGKRVVD